MPRTKIQIFEIKSPGQFYGRELIGGGSEESRKFKQLEDDLQTEWNNDQLPQIPYNPIKGEICIARKPKDKKWCRVQIGNTYQRSTGPQADCYLLDYGTNEFIPTQWLRKANPSMLRVPYQVKEYCLYGIQALTMALHEDCTVKPEPCLIWDNAAISFMKNLCEEARQTEAEVIHTDDEEIVHIILYLTLSRKDICLNDELVNKNYGTETTSQQGEIGHKKSSGLLELHSKLKAQALGAGAEGGATPIKSKVTDVSALMKSLGISKKKTSPEVLSDPSESRLTLSGATPIKSKLTPESTSIISAGIKKKTVSPEILTDQSDLRRLPSPSYGDKSAFSSYLTKVKMNQSAVLQSHSDTDNLLQSMRRSNPGSSKLNASTDSFSQDENVMNAPVSSRTSPQAFLNRNQSATNISPARHSNSSSPTLPSPSSTKFSPSPVMNIPRFSMLNNLLKTIQPKTAGTPTCLSDSEVFKKSPPGISSNRMTAQTDCSSSEGVENSPLMPSSGRGRGRGHALLQALRSKEGKSPPQGNKSNTDSGHSPGKSSPKKQDVRPKEMSKASDMMSKLQGKRLLENLSGRTHKAKAEYTQSAMKMAEKDGVLIKSCMPSHPIYRVDEAPLHPRIQQAMKDYVYSENTFFLQAYTWQPILRGENVVGIGPIKGGKTMAYLTPILSALMHPTTYADLPTVNGPLAIVLVPSWIKAQTLYDIASMFVSGLEKLRVMTVYGGGAEETHYISLINGCDLLIATPPCLTRMLDKRYVLLDRLSHLIIDDADILLKEYTEEVRQLMKQYFHVLKNEEERLAPQQIVIMSSQWCSPIEDFVKAFMLDPTIVITSKFESAVYGKINQVPHMCKSNQRIREITNIIDGISDGTKTMIFCSTVNKVLDLMRILKAHSVFAIECHSQMELLTLEYKVQEWNEPSNRYGPKIMVCDDECIERLAGLHLNAQEVIHFDMSATKTRFGNRLFCMLDNYSNPFQKKEQKEAEREDSLVAVLPKSHLIFTEECFNQAASIHNLLTRIKCNVPKELQSLMLGMKEGNEENDEKELCPYLKAYGTCRREHKCEQRHTILCEVDAPVNDKLTAGEVKVRVVNVVDASRYYVRVLEHRFDGTKEDHSTDCLVLLKEITSWYSDNLNRVKYAICEGDLCAYEEDKRFHRVRILAIKNSNMKRGGHFPVKAKVHFVDEGRFEDVSMDKLFELPPHLHTIPFQVMEAYICRIRPVDKDEDWTVNANTAAHEIVEGKVLEGRIVLCIGNTLWLDPLVERQYLTETKIWVNSMFVRTQLLRKGFAVDNPQHIQKLYEVCQGKIHIPDANKKLQSPEESVETDEMSDSVDFHEVFVSEMDMPDLIFLQRNEGNKRMDVMLDDMNAKMEELDPSKRDNSNLKAGSHCLAKLDDGRWYRVKILQIIGNKVEVFCADYGDKQLVDENSLTRICQEFTHLPFQAIECQLADVQPRGEEWVKESGDALWDMTHHVNEDKKRLVAKVVSKSPAMFAGRFKYAVELYDTTTADDVNLAQELVWSGLAAPKEGSTLKELSPMPPFILRKVYKHPVQRIPDLIACIYWKQDQKRHITPDGEILAIVTNTIQSDPQHLIAYGGVAPIIKLIGRLIDVEVHNNLVEALLIAAESNDRLAEELLNQDGDLSIIKCLEQNSRPGIQLQSIRAIHRLVKANSRFVGAFSDAAVIEILCELLGSTSNIKIQMALCEALTLICEKSKNASDVIHHFKVCGILQKHLEEADQDDFVETLFAFLPVLAKKNGKQDQQQREKLSRAVALKLEQLNSNEKCLVYAARFYMACCSGNRKYKTTLLEIGVALIYQRALQGSFSALAKKTFKSLLDVLVVTVPKSSLSNHPKIKPTSDDLSISSLPPVHWSQNFAKIILRIVLPSVKTEDNPIMLSDTDFSFRAKVDGKVFAFNYSLYGKIVPSLCKSLVKSGEVLVSLRKAEKGRWKRLLRQEHRPQNLSIDFDRYIDTSSDNEEIALSTDNEPFILKKTFRSLPKFSRPATLAETPKLKSESETETDSDEDNIYGADFGPIDDYNADPYDLFGCKG